MRRIPQRQYLMWLVDIEESWNEPSRTDNYLMALRNEVRGLFSKAESDLDRLRLRFSTKLTRKDRTFKTAEEVENSKAAWMAIGSISGPRPGAK